mgnify:CR=1 FL=1
MNAKVMKDVLENSGLEAQLFHASPIYSTQTISFPASPKFLLITTTYQNNSYSGICVLPSSGETGVFMSGQNSRLLLTRSGNTVTFENTNYQWKYLDVIAFF